ncbi:hypothetical protein CROQUDRAFT_650379 [Cronartium quercuum f. sp. fusiforme G11]|uniref:Uncharacterized protein n=1 Tax=Cronartium quercuum f. sp. fusiforme G11 TaxID=708437 RepID=A0A9P6THA0_9BASI|nr:hypothetical protein CROQUDRAFT_650379 [Cronartium quercuum f. sp. fusiforme G11]
MVMCEHRSHHTSLRHKFIRISILFTYLAFTIIVHSSFGHFVAGCPITFHSNHLPLLHFQGTIIGDGVGDGGNSASLEVSKSSFETIFNSWFLSLGRLWAIFVFHGGENLQLIPIIGLSSTVDLLNSISSDQESLSVLQSKSQIKIQQKKQKRDRLSILPISNNNDPSTSQSIPVSHDAGLLQQAATDFEPSAQKPSAKSQNKVLLATANPTTATNLGGQVIGGAGITGGFFSTPTAVIQPATTRLSPTTRASPRPVTTINPIPTLAPVSQLPTVRPLPSLIPSTAANPSVPIEPSAVVTSQSATATDEPTEAQEDNHSEHQQVTLPTGAIVGIAVGLALIIILVPIACIYINRRKRKQKLAYRESFLDNRIIDTTLVQHTSPGGTGSNPSPFRGTPYRGETEEYHYPAPPAPTYPALGPESEGGPLPRRRDFDFTSNRHTVDHGGQGGVDYMNVMGDQRIESGGSPTIIVDSNDGSEGDREELDMIHHDTEREDDLTYPPVSRLGEESMEPRSSSEGICTDSDDDVTFQEYLPPMEPTSHKAVKIRDGPEMEAQFPVEVESYPRVVSQVATTDLMNEIELDTNRYIDPLNLIPSFYIPRSTDSNKVRSSRPTNSSRQITIDEQANVVPENSIPISDLTRSHSISRQYDINKTQGSESGVSSNDNDNNNNNNKPRNRYLPKNNVKKPINLKVLKALSNSSSSLQHQSQKKNSSLKNNNDIKFNLIERVNDDTSTSYTRTSLDVPDPFVTTNI